MPIILPISDLRNYTDVLNQVDVNKPVYLTRNGRGTYVISKIDDYSREQTVEYLQKEIKAGEVSVKKHGKIALGEVAKKYDVRV